MRKALTWFAGLAGIAALLRRRSRRRATLQPAVPGTPAPDPAVELRQKLDETRTPYPAPSSDAEAAITLDERRARVHERAQEALDLMHGSDDAPPAV